MDLPYALNYLWCSRTTGQKYRVVRARCKYCVSFRVFLCKQCNQIKQFSFIVNVLYSPL